MMPRVSLHFCHFRVHLKISGCKKNILSGMQTIVSPLFQPCLSVVSPRINASRLYIRILCLITFTKKDCICRFISFIKTFSASVYHVMLPWSHSMPAVFWIKKLISGIKKTMSVVYKQATDQIFWVKGDFHRAPVLLVR